MPSRHLRVSLLAAFLTILAPSHASPARLPSVRDAATHPARRQDSTPCPTCTEQSLSGFSWDVIGMTYHSSVIFSTPAHQIDGGWVSFNLTNPAVPYPMVCSAESVQLEDFFYGNQWYPCTASGNQTDPTTGEEETPSTASFRYNRDSGELDIEQSWTCYDVPDYPALFSANGTTNTTLTCNTTIWQNPNWTSGEIYSEWLVDCDPANFTVPVANIWAVA